MGGEGVLRFIDVWGRVLKQTFQWRSARLRFGKAILTMSGRLAYLLLMVVVVLDGETILMVTTNW